MATAATDHAYEATLDDLAGAIRARRPTCPPRETARRLLAYDVPGHTHLVGLDHAGEKVVFEHREGRYAIALRFDADGLAAGGPPVASFHEGPGVAAWVPKLGGYWGWIHPRYRASTG